MSHPKKLEICLEPKNRLIRFRGSKQTIGGDSLSHKGHNGYEQLTCFNTVGIQSKSVYFEKSTFGRFKYNYLSCSSASVDLLWAPRR